MPQQPGGFYKVHWAAVAPLLAGRDGPIEEAYTLFKGRSPPRHTHTHTVIQKVFQDTNPRKIYCRTRRRHDKQIMGTEAI